jgi:hypothetical protein
MTNLIPMTLPFARRTTLLAGLVLALLAWSLAQGATTASAALEFESVGFRLSSKPVADPNNFGQYLPGQFTRQAGSHPDLKVSFDLKVDPDAVNDGLPTPGPTESIRDVVVDLPPGLVGDPTALPTCSLTGLSNVGEAGPDCPATSQVGSVNGEIMLLGGAGFASFIGPIALYNLEHGPDVPARFGFNYEGTVVTIDGRVRPGDYRISSASLNTSQALGLKSIDVTLWGVPADASHDPLRQLPDAPSAAGWPPYFPPISTLVAVRPFLTVPTSCTGAPVEFAMRADSWQTRGVFDSRTLSADPDGTPFRFEGCDDLAFEPSVDVQPLSHVADAPTGLAVDLQVPQSDDPYGTASAHVRRVVMTLPEGMSVSPSSAAGLGACAPSEIGLGSNDAPSCPSSSKLGEVTIDTPLLDEPLEGEMILARQNDNPFGSLIAMYLAVKGPGFYLKLPGRVDLDPNSGRLLVSFDNTPQLPFSRMRVKFPGGSQAALATPAACGSYNTRVEITSWATDTPVLRDSPMSIDQDCSALPFAPEFSAGSILASAGRYSPFSFSLTRGDRMPVLSRITTSLPGGLLANLKSAGRCGDAQAAAGSCPADSLIGSTTTLSGPGAVPLGLKGRVYLTGPYKGAPFGLSIVVPTKGQAGPFDLGDVVVRAALQVDPNDAHVTVVSDPLPTIIEGIPLRLRQVGVSIDREDFTINPTSCQAKEIVGNFTALSGETSHQTERFAVGGCGDLSFKPRLDLRLTGKKQRTTGKHPGVRATLRQTGVGESGIKKAVVKLPRTLALDPDNANALCEFEDGTKADLEKRCPKGSIVGRVRATTPLLTKPLSGNVYFVKNIRVDKKTGNKIRTLPMLVAALRGEIAINLKGTSSVTRDGRLVNTFAAVPDAPITKFNLNLRGGGQGILVVTDSARGHLNICRGPQRAQISMDGQNGKFADYPVRVKTPCASKRSKRSKR